MKVKSDDEILIDIMSKCKAAIDGYPDGHIEIGKIEKQIEQIKKRRTMITMVSIRTFGSFLLKKKRQYQ